MPKSEKAIVDNLNNERVATLSEGCGKNMGVVNCGEKWINKLKLCLECQSPKTHAERQKKYSEKHKDKIKAKTTAQYHIEIRGMCQRCKLKLAEERHHPNYDKPLYVELLCKKCHFEIHKILREMEK